MKDETVGRSRAAERAVRGRNGIVLALAAVTVVLTLAACATKARLPEEDAAALREAWTREVGEVVKDPQRADRLIALGIQHGESTRALSSTMKQLGRELQDVNRNYDSSREDYERALGRFNEKRDEALRQYLDSLFAMRQQATAEEWEALTRKGKGAL